MAEKKLFHVSAKGLRLARHQNGVMHMPDKKLFHAGLEPDHFSASEVTRRRDVSWMGAENLDCVTPYGPEGEPSPQETVNEYLDKLAIK